MAESGRPPVDSGEWSEFVAEMNESLLAAMERNAAAQAQFVESWVDAVDVDETATLTADGTEGYANAYRAWMRAAETLVDRANDALEGSDVSPEDVRDIWLNTANEAFKEVLSTSAFAAATGETVDGVLDLQRQADEAAEETLHSLRFATAGDVEEVGDRLLELERRQQAVEERLDRVLEELGAEA
jgi:hypothetical protein